MVSHQRRDHRVSGQPTPHAGRPLRAAFLVTDLRVGGAEVLLARLCEGFSPDRIEPTVVCLKEQGELGAALAARGFNVEHRFIGGKYDVRVVQRLRKLFRNQRIDAVVTVGGGDKMFWGRIAAKLAGVPVIASALHSTGWPDGVTRMNRWLTPITDAFIAVADHHAQHLREVERFPSRSVHVIRNGVDTDRFLPDPSSRGSLRAELSVPASTPLVGIVAALRAEKNHAMLVRAFAQLSQAHRSTHAVVVGDGPMRGQLEAAIAEHRLQDRFHLLGTRHDTPRILAALDAFVLCSHNEASPVSILEALSCGVPVVSTRVGSVPETVVDGETGYLVPVDDHQAMATAIERLLADPALRHRLGSDGRQRVIDRGSLRAMVEGYESLLHHLWLEKRS
jgi:glycosyltransferase involved in cell wall biosynthesis